MRKRFLEYVMNSSSSSSQFGHNHLHLLHESEALSEEKKNEESIRGGCRQVGYK